MRFPAASLRRVAASAGGAGFAVGSWPPGQVASYMRARAWSAGRSTAASAASRCCLGTPSPRSPPAPPSARSSVIAVEVAAVVEVEVGAGEVVFAVGKSCSRSTSVASPGGRGLGRDLLGELDQRRRLGRRPARRSAAWARRRTAARRRRPRWRPRRPPRRGCRAAPCAGGATRGGARVAGAARPAAAAGSPARRPPRASAPPAPSRVRPPRRPAARRGRARSSPRPAPALSGRCSVSHSSSFIVRPVQVGAQPGACAVDAGADRAHRDAGGARDLGVGQVGPGVQQQRVAVAAGDAAQGLRQLRAQGACLDAAERVLGEVALRGRRAARRGGRTGGSGAGARWWRCRTATGGRRRSAGRSARGRRTRSGTSRPRGPPPPGRPGSRTSGGSPASGGRTPRRTPPRRSARRRSAPRRSLSCWSSTGTHCQHRPKRFRPTGSQDQAGRRGVGEQLAAVLGVQAALGGRQLAARVDDVAVGEHAAESALIARTYRTCRSEVV